MNDCFGLEEIITYDNIESTVSAITAIYEEIEMNKINKQTEELIWEDIKEEEEKLAELESKSKSEKKNGDN